MADTLIYLKFCKDESGEGAPLIEGESTAVGYERQIEIESVEWGVSLPSHRVAAEQGQLKFNEFTLEKHVDVSTCALLQWAKTRKRATKPEGKDQIKRMTVTYVDMVLSPDGNANPVPVVEFRVYGGYLESISLNVSDSGKGVALKEILDVSYQKIDIVYHPLSDDRRHRGAALTFRGLVPGKVE